MLTWKNSGFLADFSAKKKDETEAG